VLMCGFVHYVPSHDFLLVLPSGPSLGSASPPTKSMCSLVASTVHNDSDGEEATEPYDDEKTETDSSVSVLSQSQHRPVVASTNLVSPTPKRPRWDLLLERTQLLLQRNQLPRTRRFCTTFPTTSLPRRR
jgi:hypothetical protein